MIDKKSIALVTALFLATGISAAAVLGSYGTLEGNAEVKPSLSIKNVDAANNETTVKNNMGRDFDSSAHNVYLKLSDSSVSVDKDIPAGQSETFEFSGGIYDGGSTSIKLEINGNVVNESEAKYSNNEVQPE